MKKQSMRNFICGFFTALLLLAFVVPSFAESASRQITATYGGIEIYINGAKLVPKDVNGNYVQPFVVDGTTYLPIRAVAEAVGYDVNYDDETHTATLAPKTKEVSPSPSPTRQPLNTTLQSRLFVRVNACIRNANAELGTYQNKSNDLLSRGMSRSSMATQYQNEANAIRADLASMQTLASNIQSATTNDQLSEYENQVGSYESAY